MVLHLKSENGEYDINIGRNLLENASGIFNLDRKVLIVTDSGVPEHYAKTVASQCKTAHIVTVPQGEASKNLENFSFILSKLLEFSFSRRDCIVAVGGGVVGDLSGFAAACYMRGIDFYNIPTTLLSQVDSSIGGKTAVDFCGVKNIVGAFYQPKGVIIDPNVLKTLDSRQLHAGLAEAIKMSLTNSSELFEIIEKSNNLSADIEDIIVRSLMIKKAVVEEDPKENGLRKVLNFGHTIGHAIESVNEGKMLHGECVAAGMIPFCGKEVQERLINVLKKYELPYEIKEKGEELLPFILHDKKAENGSVNAVVVEKAGSFSFRVMTAGDFLKILE